MTRDPELAAASVDVLGAALAATFEQGAALAAISTPADIDLWLTRIRSVAEDALVLSWAIVVAQRRFGAGLADP